LRARKWRYHLANTLIYLHSLASFCQNRRSHLSLPAFGEGGPRHSRGPGGVLRPPNPTRPRFARPPSPKTRRDATAGRAHTGHVCGHRTAARYIGLFRFRRGCVARPAAVTDRRHRRECPLSPPADIRKEAQSLRAASFLRDGLVDGVDQAFGLLDDVWRHTLGRADLATCTAWQ